MFIIILALAIIGMAALAPLFGSDSRDLGSSHPATFPALLRLGGSVRSPAQG